jgi:uncharacterized protein
MVTWFISLVASTAVVVLTIGSVMILLGRRFIEEFTRPGVTIEQGTPQWGGWTFPTTAAEPPTALQHVLTFSSADGALLHEEFWAQPCRSPTIILSHGFHLPSVYFRSVAATEYAHGANILLFDYRGHGKSELLPTTCGNAEVNDLVAAVEVAAGQPETMREHIYIHGFSMGAAVALLLPPHLPVAGIIADSPYARLDEMIHKIITQILEKQADGLHGLAGVVRTLLPSLTRLTMLGGFLLFHARYRYPLVARPDRAIGGLSVKQTQDTTGTLLPRILLIHAEDDPLIALHHAHRLTAAARAAKRPIQEYYTPCNIHCGSFGYDPQRYMTLLREFVAI